MPQLLTSMFSLSRHQPHAPLDQETAAFLRHIRTLTRRTRQVFVLSRLDQLSYGAIAQLLDIDISAVERRMVRALGHCSDLDRSSSADAAGQQARRWYVHLQSPQATASQRIEFRHWLDADMQHLQAFEQTERLWRQLHAPAAILGASGWHRRKRRGYLLWALLTTLLCSVLVTAQTFI